MSFWWLSILASAWVVFALLCHWLARFPRPGSVEIGAAYRINRLYANLRHRLRIIGSEHIPPAAPLGGLMIVCNHTAGVDPALVQAACPFEIRWMMAKDMMLPQYQWVWEMGQVIPVDRNSTRDTSSLRTALSHLEAGGVLGVFPEGKIEDPPGELLPFKPGVGVMIKKTGVPVLPVFIQGTPTSDRAWDSLRKTSRSKVTFGPPMLFAGQSTTEIISSLEAWFREQATRGIR